MSLAILFFYVQLACSGLPSLGIQAISRSGAVSPVYVILSAAVYQA